TSIDPNTLVVQTVDGEVITDPTEPDGTCLSAPNDVPVSLTRQSPILTPAHFVFGGHDFGMSQYVDVLQRASFARVLGTKVDQYHVLLDPVRILDPVLVDVPANEGLAVTDPSFFAQFGFPICAPVQVVDFIWFESYLQGTVIPRLAERG